MEVKEVIVVLSKLERNQLSSTLLPSANSLELYLINTPKKYTQLIPALEQNLWSMIDCIKTQVNNSGLSLMRCGAGFYLFLLTKHVLFKLLPCLHLSIILLVELEIMVSDWLEINSSKYAVF